MSPNSFVVLSSGDEGAECGDGATEDYETACKVLFDHIVTDIHTSDTSLLVPWPTTINLARSLTMSVLNGMAAGLVKMARSSIISSSRVSSRIDVNKDCTTTSNPRFQQLEIRFNRLSQKCKALWKDTTKWVGGRESRQL